MFQKSFDRAGFVSLN